MARASKDADRLMRLCERSMYRPAVGPGSAGLAKRGWAFFTRSTARGVLDGCELPPTAGPLHIEIKKEPKEVRAKIALKSWWEVCGCSDQETTATILGQTRLWDVGVRSWRQISCS